MEKALKVFDIKDGELYFLFNGLNGSRQVHKGKWLKAKKRRVRDAIGPYYQSGFHAFKSAFDISYWLRWVTHIENRVVVEVTIDHVKLKPNGRGNVLLADEMLVHVDAKPIPLKKYLLP